jgi:hypothetical protein
MSKPLPTQSTFGGLAPPWNLPNLDANFTNVWAAINDVGTYSNTLTDTGTVNALVCTTTAGITFSLVAGTTVDVIVGNTTTTSVPTLNINGTGAQSITYTDGSALVSGALLADGFYHFIYDGGAYRVLNPSNPAGALCRVTPSVTARTSTTLSNDPNLQIGLSTGTFRYELFLFPYQSTTTAQGFALNVNFSGAFTVAASNAILMQVQTSGIPYVNTFVPVASQTTSWLALPNNSTLSTQYPVWITGVLATTGAGILGLSWAQANSNANASNLGQGSYLTVTVL